MKIQRFIWLINRFAVHLLLMLISAVIIVSLTRQIWFLSLIGGIVFLFVLYKGLIRLKILRNSVVVRHGRVFFFVPETTVRDRADFVTRGQKVIQLPEYQLLDRAFKVEFFFPGKEASVCSCRLSLRLAYSMRPAAWQRAYDSFVEYGEDLPEEVKRGLLKSCDLLNLHPLDVPGEEAIREFLAPVIAQLNLGLESFGLEVVKVHCSFREGLTLARYLAADQHNLEDRSTEDVFKLEIRGEEGEQRSEGALLGVDGSVARKYGNS